jgi:5-(carboxyamino)imidazole ribonucleotide mutase
VALLANHNPELAQKLKDFREAQRQVALNMTLPPSA